MPVGEVRQGPDVEDLGRGVVDGGERERFPEINIHISWLIRKFGVSPCWLASLWCRQRVATVDSSVACADRDPVCEGGPRVQSTPTSRHARPRSGDRAKCFCSRSQV